MPEARLERTRRVYSDEIGRIAETLPIRSRFELLEAEWPTAESRGGCKEFAIYLRRQADLMDQIHADRTMK